MQRFIRAAAVAALAAAVPSAAWAWDYPGHRIVGEIADLVLQRDHPETYTEVIKLLNRKHAVAPGTPDRSLSDVAVFPDCAKNEPDYCLRTPSKEEIDYVLRNIVHKTFHFTNSSLEQPTYRPGGVGTGPTDVVQMLMHAVKQLRKKPNFYKYDVDLTDTEAVWLLAHLVGDVHQPLHVGQAYFDTTCKNQVDPNASKTVETVSTFGGNSIKIEPPLAKSLHFYWDGTAVAKAMKDDGVAGNEAEFAKRLANAPPTGWETAGEPETWPEKWYVEIMDLAKRAHPPGIEGTLGGKPVFPSATVTCRWKVTLDSNYQKWASDQAREQLKKAGYRLAALLHATLAPPAP